MSAVVYRVFLSFSTGEDGLPVTGNDPSYYRIDANAPFGVEFWSGGVWEKSSVVSNEYMLWDDILGSGATLRELLDEEEWPS